jgi:hypothetical protein
MSTVPPPQPTVPLPAELDHCRHYEIFRDYVKHEDELINNRLNWNFTIQGFLFAAYTFSLQKVSEVRENILLHLPSQALQVVLNSHILGLRELRIAMVMVALVGLSVSGWVYLSVSAARIAIDEVVRKWHTLYPDYGSNPTAGKRNTHGPYLPGLTGGGHVSTHDFGFMAPRALPLGFVAAWLLLIVFWVIDARG